MKGFGLGVWGLKFKVEGQWFRILGCRLGSRVWVLRSRVWFEVHGLWFRVEGVDISGGRVLVRQPEKRRVLRAVQGLLKIKDKHRP